VTSNIQHFLTRQIMNSIKQQNISSLYNITLITFMPHHKVRHPRCVYIINYIGVYRLTQLSGGDLYIYIYIIYYIENNYMFRRLIMAIFRLYMKYLVTAWTLHASHTIQPLGQTRDLVPTLPPPYPI